MFASVPPPVSCVFSHHQNAAWVEISPQHSGLSAFVWARNTEGTNETLPFLKLHSTLELYANLENCGVGTHRKQKNKKKKTHQLLKDRAADIKVTDNYMSYNFGPESGLRKQMFCLCYSYLVRTCLQL